MDNNSILFKEKYIVGFTGTQKGMTVHQIANIEKFFRSVNVIRVHHGDCIGADEQFHRLAASMSIPVTIHPPIKSDKRAYCSPSDEDEIAPSKDYLVRNKDIVDSCNILIATPSSAKEQLRSGTWSTVRYAKKMHKITLIILPNGNIKKIN